MPVAVPGLTRRERKKLACIDDESQIGLSR